MAAGAERSGGAGAEAALLERLETAAATDARRYAEQVDLLRELSEISGALQRVTGVDRYLPIDVAGTLRIGQHAADLRLHEAERLHTTLTLTLARLRSGTVLVPQARIVLEETRRCSEQVAAEAERRLYAGLSPAALAGMIGGKLSRRVKAVVLEAEAALEPDQTLEREADARAERRVTVRSEPDATASLWALLPADQMRQFVLGLDELTRRQKQADLAAGTERTADQRRADLFAMLPGLALHALDGTVPLTGGGHPSIVVGVQVPMATALGLADAPGHLVGYGPISAATVRRLLPTARLRRVLVDARTGETLAVAGRTTSAAQQAREEQRPARRQPEAPDTSETSGPSDAWRGRSSRYRPEAPDPAGSPRTPGLPDGPLRRALLAMLPDEPVLVDDTPEPQYRPSAPLALLVRTRDPYCTGIACDRAASHDDLDHRVRWPLGPTSAGNLAAVSRRCHNAKTRSWSLTRHADGSSSWTSPTGRSYLSPSPWTPPPDVDAHRPVPPPPEGGGTRWRPRSSSQGPDDDLADRLDRLDRLDRSGGAEGRDVGLPPACDPVPPPF